MDRQRLASELVKLAKSLTAGGGVSYVIQNDRIAMLARYYEQGIMTVPEIVKTSNDVENQLKRAAIKVMRSIGRKYNTDIVSDVQCAQSNFMFQSTLGYLTDGREDADELASQLEELGIRRFR